MDLFDENGNVWSYEAFMFSCNFPIQFQLFRWGEALDEESSYGSNERKLPELIMMVFIPIFT